MEKKIVEILREYITMFQLRKIEETQFNRKSTLLICSGSVFGPDVHQGHTRQGVHSST